MGTYACGPRMNKADLTTDLVRGDRVVRKRDTAQQQIGTVLAVWPAQWSNQYASGTMLAKVRFVGTWRRWGGGRGDAVVTMKASNLVKVDGEAQATPAAPQRPAERYLRRGEDY